jgi:pimeloyl-ACP methyl ester carboxylesterase
MAMQFLDEVTEQGVTERRFDLQVEGQRVPGIVWTPEGARGPRPLLLQGHGGIQHKRVENVLSLARRMAGKHGWAVAAIDAPGHGDRITPEEAERVRARIMQGARRSGMSDEQRRAMANAARAAVSEWKATLDALQALPEIGKEGPVSYWGVSMGTRYGVPLIASDPRIRCAVLGLFGIAPDPDEFSEQAGRVEIPLLFLFQLNDELMTPEAGLRLFSTFGSKVKTMHINPGSHVAVPMFERDEYEAFFLRHAGAAAAPT